MRQLADALRVIDEDAIRAVLHRKVVTIIDSGGLLPAGSAPLRGREATASTLSSLRVSSASVARASINGVPGVTLAREGQVIATITAEMRSGLLSSVWVVCNPDKLRHWNRD